jgi:hypothetical protein
MTAEFNDFGKLYKAAFAEREPERKLFLLKQVQNAIEEWQKHSEPSKLPGFSRRETTLSRTA